MKTTIVIGGGPAGLIAASKLADAGVKTTVLEAKARFGGRAASERQDSFDLNQGPHALYVGGAAMRELRALGVDPPGWNPASVTSSLLIRDGKLRRTLGPRTLAALGGLLRRVMKRPTGLEGISVAEWLDAELRSPSGREAAAALVRVLTFVADHERLSADVAAGQLRIGLNPGVRYIEGGWQWLADSLAVETERRGAELKTRAAVRALERSGDGWSVVTDDAEHEADAVIVAAGQPAAVAKLVGDRVSPPGPPAEISSLDLGLRRLPRRRHTFALLDQPTYFSRHSHPKKPDGALLTIASYAAQPLEALEASPT
ncbi:MAG: protoporphyrinogen/coproporphyrinogen oxidase [Solirubrobacteraceae bacterium]